MSISLNALGLHSCDIGNVFHTYISIKFYNFLLYRHYCSVASFYGEFLHVSTQRSGMYTSLLLMICYDFPWRFSVSMSAQISSVVQYSTVIYLLFITSFTKKYITLMCLVLLKLDLFSFIIRCMVMRLSWNMMLLYILYPCD